MARTTWRRPSKRARAIAVFVALLLLAAVPVARAVDDPPALTNYPGGTWEPQEATFGTSIDKDVQVRMRLPPAGVVSE